MTTIDIPSKNQVEHWAKEEAERVLILGFEKRIKCMESRLGLLEDNIRILKHELDMKQ